jgi:hypothetical protein
MYKNLRKKMIIYKYDAITKEFDREMTAQKNPLIDGEFLYPPYITLIKPDLVDGYISIFDEAKQKWNNVIDNRGMTVYNILGGFTSIVDYLGKIKKGFTLIEPTGIYDVNFVGGKWVTDRAGKLRELKDTINEARNKLYLIQYGNNSFQTDEISINRMNETSVLLDSFFWRDADNKKVLVTNKDLDNIVKMKVNSRQSLIDKQFEIEEEISNLTDEEVIDFEIKIED